MDKKYKNLLLSLLFDGIGMLSFVIPGIGEFFDIIWAPISGYLLYNMYKGSIGKIGGLVSFVEEIGFLGTDFVPTFTLTWVYTYFLKNPKDYVL